jgi:hypothetical protein
MKKKNNCGPQNRIDISVSINIDNDIDAITSLSIPHGIHTTMQETKEVTELATYFATALDDHDALKWHLKKVRQHPKEVLMAIFHHVMNKPQGEISTTRRRYYNYRVGLYEKTGNYPRD